MASQSNKRFDWVSEKEPGGKPQAIDKDARQTIRRRATQAATLTKWDQRDHLRPPDHQMQVLRPWVVGEYSSTHPSPTNVQHSHISASSPAVVLETGGTTLPEGLLSPFSAPTATLIPLRLFELAQRSDFQDQIIKSMISRCSLANGNERYFKLLQILNNDCLPSLSNCYGRSDCLDAAIDCVVTRFRELLGDPIHQAISLQLYGRALGNLRQSLEHAHYQERFEIYQSVPLLMLFELLNPLDQTAYMNHKKGIVNLLHLIGPDNMSHDRNRLLLAGQASMKIFECVRDKQDHFCNLPSWKSALLQTVQAEDPLGSSRDKASVTLTIIAAAIPTVFNNVDDVIYGRASCISEALQAELKAIESRLRAWLIQWETALRATAANPQQQDKQHFQLALAFTYKAISSRLAATLPVFQAVRIAAELAALEAADSALQTIQSGLHESVWPAKTAFLCKVAFSITTTSTKWQNAIRTTNNREPIGRILFEDWSKDMNRQAEWLKE